MRYDRRLPAAVLDLLRPAGELGWLVSWVRGAEAAARHARLDFRGNGARSGEISVYFGRTVVLGVAASDRAVTLDANESYRDQSPGLRWTEKSVDLVQWRDEMAQHLDRCALHASYEDGEGDIQGDFVRRYTLDARADEPLVLDTEVQVAFAHVEARDVAEAAWRASHPTFFGRSKPRKLDALAVLPDRRIAIVELKREDGDIVQAVRQVGVHALRWRELLPSTHEAVAGLAAQKALVGLLPSGLQAPADAHLVPVVAASDARTDWAERWRDATATLRASEPVVLAGMRFWRLAQDGSIAEDVAA